MTFDAKRIAEVRAITEKATGGNWYLTEVTNRPGNWNLNSDVPDPPCSFTAIGSLYYGCRKEDGEFCVEARRSLPAALDEIERLQALGSCPGCQEQAVFCRQCAKDVGVIDLVKEIERLRAALTRLSSPSWVCEVVQDMKSMDRRRDAELAAERTVAEMVAMASAALGAK